MEPVVTFDCPICGEQVRMEETPHHNLRQETHNHIDIVDNEPVKVQFSRLGHHIRNNYDFVNHKLPIIFLNLDSSFMNDKVLKMAVESMEDVNLGVHLSISVGDSRAVFIYAWRHGAGPRFYAVVRDNNQMLNIHAGYTANGLLEFMNHWLDKQPNNGTE